VFYIDEFKACDGLIKYGYKKHLKAKHGDNEFAFRHNHIIRMKSTKEAGAVLLRISVVKFLCVDIGRRIGLADLCQKLAEAGVIFRCGLMAGNSRYYCLPVRHKPLQVRLREPQSQKSPLRSGQTALVQLRKPPIDGCVPECSNAAYFCCLK
jgi:hypothetical protein